MSDLKISGKQSFMGKEIPIVLGGFGQGQRCMADKTIAEIHNMEAFNVRARVTDNLKRFIENVDFIDLGQRLCHAKTSTEMQNIRNLLADMGYTKQAITQAEHIYILSERGYAKLIKIMDSDLAWKIHDQLVDEYFVLREEKKQERYEIVRSDAAKEMLAQAKLNNSKARIASLYMKIGDHALTPAYQQIMYSKATEVLSGEMLLPLPKMERMTYTAEEIGKQCGMTANMVGRLANGHDLKTDEYGEWVHDKAKHCEKQVKTFRYYENVVPVLQGLLKKEEAPK